MRKFKISKRAGVLFDPKIGQAVCCPYLRTRNTSCIQFKCLMFSVDNNNLITCAAAQYPIGVLVPLEDEKGNV